MCMFRCPNCGGKMVFDIPSQQLKCTSCGSQTEVRDYREDNSAAYDGMTLYTCRSCGAQLVSPDESAVAFCSYCGSEQILAEKYTGKYQPRKIIPFRVSGKECRDAYTKILDKAFYAPKEFRDPAFIDRFRGIYIPYWNYRVGFTEDELNVKGEKEYTKGDYIYTEEYDLKAKIEGKSENTYFDASSNFDDSIAEQIVPFREKGFVDYDPGYLAGFYADRADVPEEQYREEAEAQGTENAVKGIAHAYRSKKITPRMPKNRQLRELLGTHLEGADTYLFPVWFLTWRKRDRVAYAVVNGQTGKITSDLPVDTGRFFIVTLVTAAALFALLTLFVSMTAPTALFFSALIAVIVSNVYRREVMNIHDRENHVFDKGWFVEGRNTEITAEKAVRIRRGRTGRSVLSFIASCIIVFFIAGLITMDYSDSSPADRALIGCFILLVPAFWNLIRTLLYVIHLKDKSVILEALTCFAGNIAAYLIVASDPVYDWYYYAGCLLCMAGVFITCLGLIRRYNVLATRAVPELFAREGGPDHA